MFLKDNSIEEMSTDDFNKIYLPFEVKCIEYLDSQLVPRYVSFYIATGFKESALSEASFTVLIRTSLQMFNYKCDDLEHLKDQVTQILRDEYNLVVEADDPLSFKDCKI